MIDITKEEFIDAQKCISSHLHHTDIVHSTYFSNLLEADVNFKCENLQKTCSFKIRGAMNKVSKLVKKGKCTEIVTASAGNHAQGVAYAGKTFKIPVTIFMPVTTPLIKVESAKSYGANIILTGNNYDEAYNEALKFCEDKKATFVHAYNDLDVIEGQGTIASEILDDCPDCNIIITPAGGGGLLSGVSTAAKKIKPDIKVYGVQAEESKALALSFKQKELLKDQPSKTIADGIAVGNPGNLCFELIQRNTDDIFTVSEEQIAEATVLMIERTKLVCEPASATPLAALLNNKEQFKGKKIVCVVSGGNIDLNKIHKFIEIGMIENNRWIRTEIITKRHTGVLEKLFHTISELGASIVNFSSDNYRKDLAMDEGALNMIIQVRDKEHGKQVIEELKKQYHIELY